MNKRHRYLFIKSGLLSRQSDISIYQLHEFKDMNEVDNIVRVQIPEGAPLSKHKDKETGETYYTLPKGIPLGVFPTKILTRCFGEWKNILTYAELEAAGINPSLWNKGYTYYSPQLGYMTEKQTEYYNKSQRMLFG